MTRPMTATARGGVSAAAPGVSSYLGGRIEVTEESFIIDRGLSLLLFAGIFTVGMLVGASI